MKFAKLYLTHFGEVTDVSKHLAQYALRVEQVHECVQSLMDQGLSGDALREAYTKTEHDIAMKAGVSGELWQRHQFANHTSMCADGISLFIKKQRES